MNFFCFRPNREDARFNQKAVKQGGKVVNVYDGRDFLFQKLLGSGLSTKPALQRMLGAINVPINTTPFYKQIDAHTTIKTHEKWNQYIAPLLRK